jgi:hypothetical protein
MGEVRAMAIEVRYSKRAPRVRSTRAKAKVSRRKLLFFKGAPATTEAVLDLSSSGMKVLGKSGSPAKGDRLAIEIAHPSLTAVLEVDGIVRWVRPEPGGAGRWSAGVEFVELTDGMRAQIERMIGLELGSMLSIGTLGHVGFVTRGVSEQGLGGTLFVYDLERIEIATIQDEKLYLHATTRREGEILHKQAGSLNGLLRWVFDQKEGKVTLEPPIEFEPGKSG